MSSNGMSNERRPRSSTSRGIVGRAPADRRLGTASATFGGVALAAMAWLWLLTLPEVNPPNFIRILGLIWLPIGAVVSVATGLLARRGGGRVGALVGLTLTAAALVWFVALMATADS